MANALSIGLDSVGGQGDAAGIGVLDDDAGRRCAGSNSLTQFVGRIGIVDVVVGEFLALELLRSSDPGRSRAAIERGLSDAGSRHSAGTGPSADRQRRLAEPVRVARELPSNQLRDRGVIGGGAGIGLGGKAAAQREVVAPLLASSSAITLGVVRGITTTVTLS